MNLKPPKQIENKKQKIETKKIFWREDVVDTNLKF